jgi:hypothetical protein
VQTSSVGRLQAIYYNDTGSGISICRNSKSLKQAHLFFCLHFIKGATVLDFPFTVLSMASTLFIHGLDVSEKRYEAFFLFCLHFHLVVWTW